MTAHPQGWGPVAPACLSLAWSRWGATGALRVALMNDYEVVVRGLRTMLEPYVARVHVVELDSQLPVVSDVDVLLYDAFSRERVVGPVREVLDQRRAPRW